VQAFGASRALTKVAREDVGKVAVRNVVKGEASDIISN